MMMTKNFHHDTQNTVYAAGDHDQLLSGQVLNADECQILLPGGRAPAVVVGGPKRKILTADECQLLLLGGRAPSVVVTSQKRKYDCR